ncbi:MAG TPA: dihydrolipoamide acetyltransferase family protein [Microbacterium sp.]|nr:dihydrolipoamide acetyltransferase family protein [Microbacterium sp.]
MTQDFRLPDLGEGLPDAELVQWLVKEGDTVALNQTIAEVETAKASIELPSPYAGVVQTLHAQPGDVVAVGSVIISFGDGTEDAPAPEGAQSASAEPESAEALRTPNLVGYGAETRTSGRPQRRARTAGGRSDTAVLDAAVLEAAPHDAIPDFAPVDPAAVTERPRSTPPVRAHATQLGIDLALVEGTGQDGLITREDVDAFAARAGVAEAAAPAEPEIEQVPDSLFEAGGATRIPIRGVRRHTADAMVRSAFTAPHVTSFHTVDITKTMEFLAALKADKAYADLRIGPLAVVAKAVCLALRRTPMLNSSWDEDAGEIVQYGYVNLGIAAATERGLVVPNVPGADRMTLVQLAGALGELTRIAREGRTTPAQMMGGTFTITNIGALGIEAGTPILNPGEAGILGVGAVQRRPWEFQGEVALRDVVTLSLSFDHRLVDGAEGARFLRDVGDILQEPGRALLFG